jgi:hypothetical protein
LEAHHKELYQLKIPAEPLLIADDVTPEKLATMLSASGGALAIMSGEGGILDTIAGRYSSEGVPNLDVLLKAYTGETIRIDRQSRGSEYVHRPALTIGLMIQPVVLQSLQNKRVMKGKGLFARFFYSLPESNVGKRKVDAQAISKTTKAAYENLVQRLLTPSNANGENPHQVNVLEFDEAAKTRLREIGADIEYTLADPKYAHMKDWLSKILGGIVRVCALLHMVKYAFNDKPWATKISKETLEDAYRIGGYLFAHAHLAYSLMQTDVELEDAKKVLCWIKQRQHQSFSRRELHQDLRGSFPKSGDLERSLVLLVQHNYIRRAKVTRNGRPGRVSEVYEVNPDLYPHNPQNQSAN